MRCKTDYLTIETDEPMEFVNITDKVAEVVRESGIEEGMVLVNSMHITSSVFINDEEGGLKQDYLEWLEELARLARLARLGRLEKEEIGPNFGIILVISHGAGRVIRVDIN